MISDKKEILSNAQGEVADKCRKKVGYKAGMCRKTYCYMVEYCKSKGLEVLNST